LVRGVSVDAKKSIGYHRTKPGRAANLEDEVLRPPAHAGSYDTCDTFLREEIRADINRTLRTNAASRNFKPPFGLRPIKRAAEDDKTTLVDGTMNANPATKLAMMPIKNLAKNCPVGFLKPRCTMRPDVIDDQISQPC
jgi:hypothetical protein